MMEFFDESGKLRRPEISKSDMVLRKARDVMRSQRTFLKY